MCKSCASIFGCGCACQMKNTYKDGWDDVCLWCRHRLKLAGKSRF